LREEIGRLKQGASKSNEPGNSETDELKNIIASKDNQIAQMEAAMARTGKGNTYLHERKFQRKIEELEGQIKIMKRAEQEMKKRFEEAMLKSEFKEEDGW
jgi:hypothetical protein